MTILSKLEKGKLPFFDPIYSLQPIELESLKTYIKIKSANNFMRLFKFLAGTPIIFDKKPNKSFHFYVDYKDLNNFIIKN